MGDPFSATSNAVEIVSLGLTVCGEIVAYGRAYRDYGEDIRNMTTKAESLRVPLKALKEMIEKTRISQPDAAADLSEKAMSLNASVTRLQDIIKRYEPTNAPAAFPDKARNHLKRAVYHFRKETLQDIGADLDSMQTILQTALAVYAWEGSLRVAEEIEQMGNSFADLLKSWCDDEQKKGHRSDTTTSSNVLSEQRGLTIHRQKAGVSKKYNLYNRWLRLGIEISFSMTTGAGGFWICPALSIQIPIVEGSRKYREIHRLTYALGEPTERDRAFLALQNQFLDQKLHPSCVMSGRHGVYSLLDTLFHNAIFGRAFQWTENDDVQKLEFQYYSSLLSSFWILVCGPATTIIL
ncbi:hypothetical protein ASPZODRAFT_1104449 [Penicilliopsis zonata CBS 506.65]|uniref:NACHT-NTPase and P-loop NTPases N-terminal domain-containing protein n=1 Tax=Penicilliopsis zonata CBS 506.65 TaxID=1073090 RepID=A0A1L9SSL5_9EURO|nr:hypothetical protein ASPZODRAFT_1104449 [Penicilliopsis zonata CBS 506.65]OJJ50104.1 hypothetical protein ASPZODRAFT_1104449 [Penicilliopsis zonata CBS 506.65]